MVYIAAALRITLVVIGIIMMINNPAGSPPYLSGIAFIVTAISLCLNRPMAVKNTPCIISYFKK